MDAPFDRGEVDRASLDATERLRARLSSRPPTPPERRRASVLPWVIAGGLFVFSAGMIANPWFEASVRSRLPFADAPAPDAVAMKAMRSELAALQSRLPTADAAMPVERLARSEAMIESTTDQISRDAERIDRLTSDMAAISATLQSDRARSEAATATVVAVADRARSMLAVIIARRNVDEGRPFGALDPVLRQSFEARYPSAVKAVAALGAAPVTLAGLRRDFEAMRPAIGARPAAEARLSWWDTLTNTVAKTLSPRAADTEPSEAARAALERGDVQAAANHLRRLPGPRPAALTRWLDAVDRLGAGTQGLAVLENGVLLAPAALAVPQVPAVGQVIMPPPSAAAPTSAAPAIGRDRPTGTAGARAVVSNALRRVFDIRALLAIRLGVRSAV